MWHLNLIMQHLHLPLHGAWLPVFAAFATRELPDVVSSSDAYATRFSGAAGEWLLSVQNRSLLKLMEPFSHASVVDVGGGHGQYTAKFLLFPLKRMLERKTTRRYFTLDENEVRQAFEEHGFRVTGRVAQFFLPMVLHRVMGNPRLSRWVEGICRRTGLTERMGSPIILRAERI